ncbi:unnamed protein product [Brassicogethes aeneus]|uniref:Angiotensin-converting enzyme n=1 Tax=Brassicogethes aeneus TaxID=1431903 RepID=A0A9P0BB96_BRAAE|nr:unnamed protein product [Brassicogethes aeneus]
MFKLPRTNLLLIILIWLIKHSLQDVIYEIEDSLQAELEMANLEFMDVCDKLADGYLKSYTKNDLLLKVDAEKEYGKLLKETSMGLKAFTNIPPELERNHTLYIYPGDPLMPRESYNKLIEFTNKNEQIKNSVKRPCVELVDGCPLTTEEYRNILKDSKDLDYLNITWDRWQRNYSTMKVEYREILNLVSEAAVLNGIASAPSYWENLLEYEDAYSKAEIFWGEIEPLYKKLHNFVKKRLTNIFNLTETIDEIPVFLLGSNFGNDWTYLADAILPHPQVHYDIEQSLKTKTIYDIYKLAETTTSQMKLGKFGNKFWKSSTFNSSSCDTHVLTYCTKEFSEVIDCNKTDWSKYLDAHQAALKITLNNNHFYSLMNSNLRVPIIDEMIESLAPILAFENLPHNKVLEENVFKSDEEVYSTKRLSGLMLLALKVLPKLPYYLLADKWRLQQLLEPTEDLCASWWEMRSKIQGVSGITNEECDFLGDSDISSNKPLIGKFFGAILGFQLLNEYRSKIVDKTQNLAIEIGKNSNFMDMVNARDTDDWQYLLTIYYGLNDFSPSALLEYFKPLEDYLESAPMKQAEIVTITPATTTTTSTTARSTTKPRRQDLKNIQSDSPKRNVTAESEAIKPDVASAPSTVTVYVVMAVMGVTLVGAMAFWVVKKKKIRTNNRRFEA